MAMAGLCGDRRSARKHVGACRFAASDPVACLLDHGAAAAAVAHGGQAGAQGRPGVGQGAAVKFLVGFAADLLDDRLIGVGRGKDEVHVGVDEAGQQGAAGEVEALAAACRWGQELAVNGLDLTVSDADQRAQERRGAGAVEKAVGGEEEGFHIGSSLPHV